VLISLAEYSSSQIHDRIIIDPEGFMKEWPRFRDVLVSDVRKDDYSDTSSASMIYRRLRYNQNNQDLGTSNNIPVFTEPEIEDLTADELITSPAGIPAYSLRAKKWGFILIDGIKDITWHEESFDGLQLESSMKVAIRDLVAGHTSIGDDFDDLIKGKGKGLVFLLYGPPGSGKTMTAGRFCLNRDILLLNSLSFPKKA
jgi:hypothetical protein